jgi:hypothetical protein
MFNEWMRRLGWVCEHERECLPARPRRLCTSHPHSQERWRRRLSGTVVSITILRFHFRAGLPQIPFEALDCLTWWSPKLALLLLARAQFLWFRYTARCRAASCLHSDASLDHKLPGSHQLPGRPATSAVTCASGQPPHSCVVSFYWRID